VRTLFRSISVAAAAVLVAVALAAAPPAAASGPPGNTSFQVVQANGDTTNWEYRWGCNSQSCSKFGGTVVIIFSVQDRPKALAPITVDYLIEDLTAVHGVNYSGPTSGTLTIPASPPGRNDVLLAIPILDTGSVGAPDKTLRVSLTGSSVPGADLSDTAIGTIQSAGEVPRDCTPSRPDSQSFSTTCTDRPAGAQWRVSVTCLSGFMGLTVHGATITGSGTSTATCTGTGFNFVYWGYQALN
jgi:hypothetical protein